MASKEISLQNQSYSISYQIENAKADESIVFLHGWGSNKNLMHQAFSKTFIDFKHIYIDMPGFGSSSEPQEAIDSFVYANIIETFLQTLHVKPKIIIGHSFGGKIATLLNPPILVLLSSAGIVLAKSLHVKSKITFFKLFKKLLPKSSYKYFASKDANKMSQVMYGVFKKVVDEDFSPIFKKFDSKAFLFWGKEDSATPLICGRKIDSMMPDSILFEIQGDHYFFLKKAKEVESEVLKGLQ